MSGCFRTIRKKTLNEWTNAWQKAQQGGHLRAIDPGLPSKHVQRLYGSLPRHKTYLLTQMRTGHSWLSTFAYKHELRADDKYECGAVETVVHVLIDCPRLSDIRAVLRDKIGNSFSCITTMLGGRKVSPEGKTDPGTFLDKKTIDAVIEYAEASKRSYREPQGWYKNRLVDANVQSRQRRSHVLNRSGFFTVILHFEVFRRWSVYLLSSIYP